MALHGVLFLDELPEFDRRVLEALREPLDAGRITISRAARQADFPARFQLVAAMNPCPCGYLGQARCRCTPDQAARYRNRISGPLMDRIDMHVDVPAVGVDELQKRAVSESSCAVRRRVEAARERMLSRQNRPNALLEAGELERCVEIDDEGKLMLLRAIAKLGLSARSYHRTMKVARTVADLAASPCVGSNHVAEALGYRHADG
jgi:magnesium chelatase family protein